MVCCRASVLGMIALCVAPSVVTAMEQAPASDSGMTGDELLFMDIPTVVTASRREQPADEAPVSLYVVTAEEIRMSGASSIPEALRLVPGLDVITLSVRNQTVGIRDAFTDPYSSRLLVMVDNRTVYWDVYGSVQWDMLPIDLGEVRQIEVMRGPGSSLYGPNAFSGVIHILTRSPSDIDGTEFSLTAGEYGTINGAARFGRAGKRLSGKVSTSVDMVDEWRGQDEPAGKIERVNGQISYRITDDLSIGGSVGAARTDHKRFFTDRRVGIASVEGYTYYGQAVAAFKEARLRLLYRGEDFSLDIPLVATTTPFRTSLVNVDGQHALEIRDWYTLLTGANYRMTLLEESRYTIGRPTLHLFGFFLDNEVTVAERLFIQLGGRYDYHPTTGHHYSPRLSLALRTVGDHRVRYAIGQAYRDPTFVNTHLNFPVDSTASTPLGDVPVTYRLRGNEDIGSQTQQSMELSYHGTMLDRIEADVSAYCKFLQGLYKGRDETTTENGRITITRTSYDSVDAFGAGGEAWLSARVFPWMNLAASYAYLKQWQTSPEEWDPYEAVPEHKVNLSSRLWWRGFSVGFDVLYRSKTDWGYGDSRLPAYTLCNATVGYQRKNTHITFAAFDLFDTKHFEYAPGDGSPQFYSDELTQKFTVTLAQRF